MNIDTPFPTITEYHKCMNYICLQTPQIQLSQSTHEGLQACHKVFVPIPSYQEK